MELKEAIAIEKRIESQDRTLDDPAAVAAAIETLCLHWSDTMTSVEMPGQLGAPDWKGFELKIWRLGESLRLYLKRKRWRGKGPLLDVAARVLQDGRFGKGRQTFALLLGEFGGQEYGEPLGRVLEDKEVRGHAVKALTKAKIGGFAAEVAGVQAQESGWIRSAARKYLKSLSS
jgi:hypothetical protein